MTLVGVAAAALKAGECELAATALGAVEAPSLADAPRLEVYERRLYEQTADTVRAEIGASRFAEAVARGSTQADEAMAEFALRVIDRVKVATSALVERGG